MSTTNPTSKAKHLPDEDIGVHWLSNPNVEKLGGNRPAEVCETCGKVDRRDGVRIMKCKGVRHFLTIYTSEAG